MLTPATAVENGVRGRGPAAVSEAAVGWAAAELWAAPAACCSGDSAAALVVRIAAWPGQDRLPPRAAQLTLSRQTEPL